MIPSFDIEKTVSFFTDLLQFQVERADENYRILYKDNQTLHILRAGPDIGEMEFYLVVDDLDEVWNGMKDKLSDHIRYREPFDREYGMREVHVIIPETKTLLFIGQSLG
jgi:catechol 2,3-dioxygenase-like lactoylglutathione lyase family enzyme